MWLAKVMIIKECNTLIGKGINNEKTPFSPWLSH